MNKGGRPQRNLTEEQKQWLRKALDRHDLSLINPGKKDNVYIEKVDGEKRCEQKRYLLWHLRDIRNILSMSDAEESSAQAFDDTLSFRMLHRFLNERKQYIYNKRIPQNTCLCEICENTSSFVQGKLHVHHHPISLPMVTQLQNITHVIVTLHNVCWDSVMNAMTMD